MNTNKKDAFHLIEDDDYSLSNENVNEKSTKKTYFNIKYSIAAIVLIVIVCTFGYYSYQSSIHASLQNYKIITGKSNDKYEAMHYRINPALDSKTIKDKEYTLTDNKQEFPVLTIKSYHTDTDYVDTAQFKSPQVKAILNDEYDDFIINNVAIQHKNIDGISCIHATYDLKASSNNTADLIENDLVGNAYYIPSHAGYYRVNLVTYKSDTNNYRYDDFIHSLDVKQMEKETLKEKKYYKSLENYKKQIKNMKLNEKANTDEITKFDQLKEEALSMIENEDSIETIKEKISVLNRYIDSVDERIAYDALKTRVNRMTVGSNANDSERAQFDTKKQEILDQIDQRENKDVIEANISALSAINASIYDRVQQEEVQRRAEQEAQRQAQEAAEQQQAQQSAATQNTASQSTSSTPVTDGSTNDYACVDGTHVGNANPHAKGRANACYGHGGFLINHMY